MSATAVTEIRRLLSEGEITAGEARDRLASLDGQTDRDELWSKFAGQGLYDDPIRQDGFTSKRGNRVETVGDDG